MIRFVLRTLGFVLLACAVLFAIIDGTKSLSASRLVLTSARDSWTSIAPSLLSAIQSGFEHYAPAFVWNSLILTLLALPTFLLLGILALLLMMLGKVRRHAYI